MNTFQNPATACASPDQIHLHASLPGAKTLVEAASVQFHATDGTTVHGQWFTAPHKNIHAVAVMAPATGVPQRYYHAFAQWLAMRGYAVLCFDYRGMSANSNDRDNASMRVWLRHDLSGALDCADARSHSATGKLPLLWIGHSLGGNGLPLVQGLERIDAAVTVGSQFGYWKLWPRGWHRQVTRFFFGTWVPLWVSLTGSLPGWALGGGETLPKGAAHDWSRWGMSPGYFRDDPRCAGWYQPEEFRGHMQLWSIEDDKTFGPVDAVDALADCYSQSAGQVERMHLHPREVGLKAVGHFGVFRKTAADKIWPLLLQCIEERVPGLLSASQG